MLAATYQPRGVARSGPILREAMIVAAEFFRFVPLCLCVEATLEAARQLCYKSPSTP
jgi:hypothetical protein